MTVLESAPLDVNGKNKDFVGISSPALARRGRGRRRRFLEHIATTRLFIAMTGQLPPLSASGA